MLDDLVKVAVLLIAAGLFFVWYKGRKDHLSLKAEFDKLFRKSPSVAVSQPPVTINVHPPAAAPAPSLSEPPPLSAPPVQIFEHQNDVTANALGAISGIDTPDQYGAVALLGIPLSCWWATQRYVIQEVVDALPLGSDQRKRGQAIIDQANSQYVVTGLILLAKVPAVTINHAGGETIFHVTPTSAEIPNTWAMPPKVVKFGPLYGSIIGDLRTAAGVTSVYHDKPSPLPVGSSAGFVPGGK